ncbi:hypothetical protein CYMTET_56953 [Cymbomonas tetramitiformis]|uniref:Uncharacterized protein n=1 Tax=Cymbomonas tetramitiformis TaxID=36881 RepID=A0AAE0BAB8_9CHLO|nr:hypothetical protein CYMTET_56953 [Cymbomonas tetramitiformis]
MHPSSPSQEASPKFRRVSSARAYRPCLARTPRGPAPKHVSPSSANNPRGLRSTFFSQDGLHIQGEVCGQALPPPLIGNEQVRGEALSGNKGSAYDAQSASEDDIPVFEDQCNGKAAAAAELRREWFSDGAQLRNSHVDGP